MNSITFSMMFLYQKKAATCQTSRTMKRADTAKCTYDQENDFNNRLRAFECSSMSNCYNTDTGLYDDSKCPANERCAAWYVINSSNEREDIAGCVQ